MLISVISDSSNVYMPSNLSVSLSRISESKVSDTEDCQFDMTSSVKPSESIQGPDRQLMSVSVVTESIAFSKIDKVVHISSSDKVSWMALMSEEQVTSCGVSA